ncbi:putative 1-acylglycerol-3-phosphate O-acyltransferase [Helianthus annuus]|nr:putative 1-acylglycerol-3-phosphate O-acyltransferase [Helianthus annuus]
MDPTSFTQTFTLSFSSLSLYIYPRISNTHRESLSLSLSASAMAIAASVVIVPIGVLFLVSGLIVNLLQALIFITIRPFSKSLFRRINRKVAELLWLELIWIVDWWSGVKIKLYTDPETLNMMVISNHKSDIDWLLGWVFAQRSGCLGSTLAVMKKSSKFLPVIGWSMWFSEFLFLERKWAKDESTLKAGLRRLKDYPQPFLMALYVEGTRFTNAKLLAAQEYASSTGLPVPRNVLIPRTKGFVTSVREMRSFAPAIMDMTVAIPKDSTPTMLRLFKGQSSVIHVRVKRHLMKDLPETDEGVAQWCKDLFVAKDDLLDQHKIADSFPDSELVDIGRPLKSLVVVVSWACLLVLGIFKFLQWSNLLSSWKGLTFTATGLGIITFLMQILIQFSQAERSSPAKVAPARSSNGNGSVQETLH